MKRTQFEFLQDYTLKNGLKVKKGEVLSARKSGTASKPRWMFEWYEGIDAQKEAEGEGVFSIYESEIDKIAKQVTSGLKRIKDEPVKTTDTKTTDTKKVDNVNPTGETIVKKTPFFKNPTNVLLLALGMVGAGFGIYFFTKKK